MTMGNPELEEEQESLKKILVSIIMLYGDNGLPLEKVDSEFINYCGYAIPFKKFGADSLRSWVITLPDIYLVTENQKEVLFQQSSKSTHIKQLISKQKTKPMSKRKKEDYYCYYDNVNKLHKPDSFPKDCFIHGSINNPLINDYERFDLFTKLVSSLFSINSIFPILFLFTEYLYHRVIFYH